MNDIMSQVDETIKTIEQSKIINRLKELKLVIDEDIKIQKLIQDFNMYKSNYENNIGFQEKLVAAKIKLYNDPIISEYRRLYIELNNSIVRFNNNIFLLLRNKKSNC